MMKKTIAAMRLAPLVIRHAPQQQMATLARICVIDANTAATTPQGIAGDRRYVENSPWSS